MNEESTHAFLLGLLRASREHNEREREQIKRRRVALDYLIGQMEQSGAETLGDLLRQIGQSEPARATRLRDALRIVYFVD